MQTNASSNNTALSSESTSIEARRVAFLRRRRVDPAVAALIAELAFATSPSWVGGRA